MTDARSLRSLARAALIAAVGLMLAVPLSPASGAPDASIASTTIVGALLPDQVVAADGQLWLVEGEENGDTDAGCQIVQMNPSSFSSARYMLPECGLNAAAGDGAIFVETFSADQANGTYDIHVERFDTTTHTTVVFAATSATTFLGSAIAHTQLAFEDGWLWFYGMAPSGAAQEVLQLSPRSGAVVRTFTKVPAIGGGEPVITGAGPYVWAAGGPGSNASFLRIDPSTGAAHAFTLFKGDVSMFSVLAQPHRVFFLYLSAKFPFVKTSSHIGRMTTNGTALRQSPNEQFGGQLFAVGHTLLSPGPGERCDTGVQVWSVDTSSLRSTPIARISMPAGDDPCLATGQTATALGASLFYLASSRSESVLTRITPG